MYDANTQLLVANPIKRYLINMPMLPDLKKNADGSIDLPEVLWPYMGGLQKLD